MKHDFRGITTQSKVEPDKMPEPTEQWSVRNKGRTHVLYPASEAALFQLEVNVSASGNCHLVVFPKNVERGANLALESYFAVDGFTTEVEVADLRRKAKAAAQRLLRFALGKDPNYTKPVAKPKAKTAPRPKRKQPT
jgi:hypothetical protein